MDRKRQLCSHETRENKGRAEINRHEAYTTERAPMTDKMQQAIAMSQHDVITAAEQKLGRSLTELERGGILKIGSLMMLESCYQSFSSPVSTQAQVLGDLEHFAKRV